MKDKIKEILDNPKILMLSYGNYISLDDYVKLKDYITNLQEEIKHLNLQLDQALKDYDEELTKRYKAIEYIKHENFKRNILLGFSEKKYVRDILNNVLEILGDKENE